MPDTTAAPLCPEPLLTTAEMAAVDAAAVAAGAGIDVLMEAAGRAVADEVPAGRAVSVLCGPGNNGGDGYVAARLLAERGRDVALFADRPPRPGGVADSRRRLWQGGVEPLEAFRPRPGQVVVDALYGAGLDRAIAGAEAEAIARLNASGAEVIAVDVPSGLNGDSGLPSGPAVEAHRTVTFFRLKPGHMLWPGRALCGRVILRDIGLTEAHLASAATPALFHNTPALWRGAVPGAERDTHKFRRGHCLVVSGAELQTGASRLAATAALNGGAGAVTIAGAPEALRIHAAHVTAIMLRSAETLEALAALVGEARAASVVIGPAAGIGAATRDNIAALLGTAVPLVLDADALTALVGELPLVRGREGPSPLVMTPHAGEFARLFGAELAAEAGLAGLAPGLRASKVEQARAAARLANAVIVYKGVDTVIAAPDGRAAINTNAGPELATAGSGDVLAGLIGAHLAQGMPGFEAAAAGVWLHGAWGARYGAGLTADRLVAMVRPLAALLGDAPAA